MCVCACVCVGGCGSVDVGVCVSMHVRTTVIYLGRQVGCCEELIMVQQSGARPCFILIMGFHSLLHCLPVETRCIRGEMGFHTHTRTNTHKIQDGAYLHSINTTHLHLQVQKYTHPATYLQCHVTMWERVEQLHLKHIEKETYP